MEKAGEVEKESAAAEGEALDNDALPPHARPTAPRPLVVACAGKLLDWSLMEQGN
ncbi:hypothetical protein AXF42_Ash011612 [Apostasia shenzhenica]|uniref:Uncharacterized protein n=1 Tax=Apostasia shenzhenica TaxID=1088818 RepID=A0A2I0BB47_9ASPA|nr:hypothetical protein AXF42_Ash011612 [Apostasia shenzhenica]